MRGVIMVGSQKEPTCRSAWVDRSDAETTAMPPLLHLSSPRSEPWLSLEERFLSESTDLIAEQAPLPVSRSPHATPLHANGYQGVEAEVVPRFSGHGALTSRHACQLAFSARARPDTDDPKLHSPVWPCSAAPRSQPPSPIERRHGTEIEDVGGTAEGEPAPTTALSS
ncbi:hypothetical protein V8E36_005107 [Tilletia maclaganii]